MFWPLWPYILHDVSFNPTIPDKGFAGIPMRIWKTIDMGRKEVEDDGRIGVLSRDPETRGPCKTMPALHPQIADVSHEFRAPYLPRHMAPKLALKSLS